jgi:uncharacterized protein (DUF983 family)
MAETDSAPPLVLTFWAGIAGRCPCHRGKLLAGYLALAPRCDSCGLDYGFADAGDGPAVFVILVAGFIVTGLALVTEIPYSPPIGYMRCYGRRSPPSSCFGPLRAC